MRQSKSSAIFIFIGLLLIAVFVVGLLAERDPGIFTQKYRYDFALEQFTAFCREFWIPAGIIGFPTFLISLLISLAQEKKRREKEEPYG